MRGNDRDHAAGAEQQPATPGLTDGIRRFCPDFGGLCKYDGMLAHSTADDARKELLRGIQRRRGFPVMPVNDREQG